MIQKHIRLIADNSDIEAQKENAGKTKNEKVKFKRGHAIILTAFWCIFADSLIL